MPPTWVMIFAVCRHDMWRITSGVQWVAAESLLSKVPAFTTVIGHTSGLPWRLNARRDGQRSPMRVTPMVHWSLLHLTMPVDRDPQHIRSCHCGLRHEFPK